MRRRAYYNRQLYKQNIVLLDYTFMVLKYIFDNVVYYFYFAFTYLSLYVLQIKIEGRWGIATKGKKQFKHETYQWDNTMKDYVIGKDPKHASEHWRTVNTVSNFQINMLLCNLQYTFIRLFLDFSDFVSCECE